MKFFFDLFPVILFFIAYKLYGVFTATAVAIGATFVQIGWLWLRHRKVETMMWVNLGVIVVFGGATLAFQDEMFIKWKPTVLYWLIALAFLISNLFFKKNLIRMMLEKQMVLPEKVWGHLNNSWILFFVLMGFLNLYVAFSFDLDTWVTFKLFGSTGIMLVFVVAQIMMLGKYIRAQEEVSPGSSEPQPVNEDKEKN